jgi:hypothetical protein
VVVFRHEATCAELRSIRLWHKPTHQDTISTLVCRMILEGTRLTWYANLGHPRGILAELEGCALGSLRTRNLRVCLFARMASSSDVVNNVDVLAVQRIQANRQRCSSSISFSHITNVRIVCGPSRKYTGQNPYMCHQSCEEKLPPKCGANENGGPYTIQIMFPCE